MNQFTNRDGRVLIEKMQSSIINQTTNTLQDIIKTNKRNKDLKILDIACGSSYIVCEALKKMKNIFYKGIDLDDVALDMAALRWSNTKHSFELIKYNVLEYEAMDFDIITCFSNTLLSLGDEKCISMYLKNLIQSHKNGLFIFSFTPWDQKRISYYQMLKDWQVVDDSKDFKVKVEIKESNKIHQRVFLKDSELETYADFSFLPYTYKEFKKLLEFNELSDIKCYDSVTGELVDPADSQCIDFLVVCRKNFEEALG